MALIGESALEGEALIPSTGHRHRHHKHRAGRRSTGGESKRPRTAYEIFRDNRAPDDVKLLRGRDTGGMHRRARLLLNPDRIAPPFLRKVDTRVVNIHGPRYQRIFRSKDRDWTQEIGESEEATTLRVREEYLY